MRRAAARSLLLIGLVALAGCETLSHEAEPGLQPEQGWLDATHQAAGPEIPVLGFYGGWTQIAQPGPIVAGQPLILRYAPTRMPTCRGTHNGFPAWLMTAHYKALPDETVHQLQLGNDEQTLERQLTVPEGTTQLELWFSTTNISGCQEWDSAFGANYTFDVAQPAQETRIRFEDDWSETPDGPVVQGGMIRVDYNPRRLPECRATYNGGRTWNILVGWIFLPGGEQGSLPLYTGDYYAGEEAITQPAFAVPEDATSVELWFYSSDRAGCSTYDSNMSQNYVFDVEPAGAERPRVQWAGNFNFVGYHRERNEMGDVDPAYYWVNEMGGAEYATWMEVQVWAPGITDRDYDSDDALRQAAARIRAEAISDAVAGSPGAEWEARDLDFERKQGNDFVYSWRFVSLYYGGGPEPGLYEYLFRFSTNDGASWYEVGKEDGSPRRVALDDRTNCDLFPDNRPDTCPPAALEIGWAGDWSSLRGHDCHEADVPEPFDVEQSALGHDCMAIAADVWVDGFTERNGDPNLLYAEVVTDIGFGGGPLAELASYDLSFVRRVNNNYRYIWQLSEHVGRSEPGEYRYWFRFSADGERWYTLGQGDGPDGGEARTLRVFGSFQ